MEKNIIRPIFIILILQSLFYKIKHISISYLISNYIVIISNYIVIIITCIVIIITCIVIIIACIVIMITCIVIIIACICDVMVAMIVVKGFYLMCFDIISVAKICYKISRVKFEIRLLWKR